MKTHREGGFYWTISVDFFCLSPCLSLSLVVWVDPWNQTSNSELPFLLATKIFIRTIRSSDKASTEGWGPCIREGRMCQQDVFTATLYTQTTGLLSSIWDTAVTLFAPSQARWQHASKPQLTHPPPHSHTIPAGPALSYPLGSGAWLHNMRIRRRGHKGELIFVTKARSHFRTHKVSEDHRGWARNIWFNKLYRNLHASSVSRSDFWQISVRPISHSLSHG